MGVEWDIEDAIETLGRATSAIEGGNLAGAAAMAFVRSTQQTAPVKTGTLRRSIRINSVSGESATYGPHVIYARIQDQGGTITVKRKKVLANRRTGQFFGKSVYIPALHYMQRGGDAGIEGARIRVAQRIEAMLGG
jgi:phage gpG-like protein